jgi:hypothetical protein
MTTRDTKNPGAQPAEDMFGRSTSPEHEEPVSRPKEAPGEGHSSSRKSTEEEQEHGDVGGLDDLPDGDGPRSDRGNNPLPEGYWADFQGEKP